MKMLLNVRIPLESFNEHVRKGTIGPTLQSIIDDIKPETVYFTEHQGCRGVVMIVEVASADRVPSIAEPWFLKLGAECEFRIAMSPEDLQLAGLEALGRKWS